MYSCGDESGGGGRIIAVMLVFSSGDMIVEWSEMICGDENSVIITGMNSECCGVVV